MGGNRSRAGRSLLLHMCVSDTAPMSTDPLPADRIRALYEAYREEDPYAGWRKSYLESLERFRGVDDEALASPAIQRELWSLRHMSTLGAGDTVNVEGAWTDPAVVTRIVELRQLALEPGHVKRAGRLQSQFDEIISLVAVHSGRRPFARLTRLFAALLPRECHAAFSTESRATIARILRGGTGDDGIIGHVIDRHELRTKILGPEADLAEDAWRATFCWWLFDHADSLVRADAAAGVKVAAPSAAPVATIEQAPTALPPLQLLPGPRLRRGFVAFKGYAKTVRLIVESVQGGATPDDVVQTLRASEGYEALGPAHARTVFNLVRNNLGMLEHRGGLWYPTKLGERLLDDRRYDPLVEKMLAEIFGLAHYLRLVSEEPLTRKASNLRLRQIYPAWTTDRAPTSVVYWAHSLGLVHTLPDRRVALTEYGEQWARRLPAELPVPPLRAGVDDGDPFDDEDEEADDVEAALEPPRPTPRLAELRADIAALRPEFVQDPGILEALHLAWHGLPGKRFVIFSGLSGTGKTLLFKLYAEAYCRRLGVEAEQHRTIVPVSPDWRDPTGLLGYFNALHADPTYQPEPALRLILQAHRHPNRPYFLILDEMNLARIEHYFAPFLSAMETGGDLHLHAHETAINRVPPAIPWPKNLFIGGTVNMDETTQPISDKVLDRAFTIEFWDVDLAGYFAARGAGGRPRDQAAEQALLDIHAILREIRRHFGYRTAGEVLAMLDAAAAEGITATGPVLDQAVFSKVLPRIRGHESKPLSDALRLARECCDRAGLIRCARKLGEMEATLRHTGLTRFWA